MDPEPEGSVTVLLAIDHELGRAVELRWVTIGRREREEHPVIRLHRAAVEVVILPDEASHGHRCVGPQELLEGEQHHLGVIDETLEVIGMSPEMPDRRPDRRPCRVDPGHQQQDDRTANVLDRELLPLDLHAEQIQGFFTVPVDNVYASSILNADIVRCEYENLIVVSPDIGGVVRARAIAKQLDDADLAIIDKRRPRANEAEVMNLIGDVEGRTAILVDDMVDTAGTLCTAANALKERGALKVVSYCTHAVLSGKALENIKNSQIDELVVTDTIPLSAEALALGKIRQLTIADLLAESIRRVSNEESISALFDLT